VYLREDPIRDAANNWISALFAPQNLDRTVEALVASQQPSDNRPHAQHAAQKRLGEAETRLRRLQAAIEAGVDPAALVDAINQAQATRAAVHAELKNRPAPNALTHAEVYAMIDSLEDMGTALSGTNPESLWNLYQAIGLQIRYEPAAQLADLTIQPMSRVNSECVRGGTGPLRTRPQSTQTPGSGVVRGFAPADCLSILAGQRDDQTGRASSPQGTAA
jgi:hypothetical protein